MLTLSWLEIPSADLGSENPHASLKQSFAPVAQYLDEEVPSDRGMPYRLQDEYDRTLKLRKHRVAVLESDRLVATFLLDLGGRLWSLIHKPTGRELLHVNPVFQPANFAIRNAWFSGGIEWNIGIFGHCVFTCSPVFSAITVAPDGTQGLRIWEYERLRGVVWQLDFWAPEGSDFLYWAPRITNTHERTIPMYWWTCIAVNEEPEGRVIAPAMSAIEPNHSAGGALSVPDLVEEQDLTFPQRRDLPHDTYFKIAEKERPWIAQVNQDGVGVVHVSTSFLPGRKQWVWGMERSGRRWQDWLNPGGAPYIEIQGGLAYKQSDYVPMPAGATWSWLEAFGPISGVATTPWETAVDQLKCKLESHLPPAQFEDAKIALFSAALEPPEAVNHMGSGWGALECERRAKLSLCPLSGHETPFPASTIGDSEGAWQHLLNTGALPELDPSQPPGDYVGPEWREFLDATASKSWRTWLHLGVVYFQEGRQDLAREAWERILPNGWAYRNLAILDSMEGRIVDASKKILDAHRLLPFEPHIVDEACQLLGIASDFTAFEQFIGGLPREMRYRPRVRLADALLAFHKHDLSRAVAYFDPPCDLIDIREAETTISELWRNICQVDPAIGDPMRPPPSYDFRMK